MKRLLLAFLLLGAAIRAEAVDYTDIWYNASQSGHGFNMIQSDEGRFTATGEFDNCKEKAAFGGPKQ